MNFFIPGLAAAGLTLLLSGLLVPRRVGLARRVDLYLTRDVRRNVAASAKESALQSVVRLLPRGDAGLEQRLAAAGIEMRPTEFRLQQAIWATYAAAIAVTSLTVLSLVADVDIRVVPVVTLLSAITAYLTRDWWLSRQIALRRTRLAEELPVAIDLLTLSIMAGDSVPSGLARVAQQMRSHVGRELSEVVGQVRAGSSIVEALEDLSRRIAEPSVSRLVDALCTGIEKGAPLAEVLRAQAEDGRELRRRMLVEVGGKREVLMMVPVVFLIMPVVVVFALYPGLISLGLLVP